MSITRFSMMLLPALTLGGLAACTKEYTPKAEIPEAREATAYETEVKEMSTAERMQMPEVPPMAAAAPGAVPAETAASEASPAPSDPNGPRLFDAPPGDDSPQYRWNLPKAWVDAGATPMRQVNLKLESNPEVELYLTMMPGDGGGLSANINRWRQQMGLPELPDADILTLPKQIILFKPGTFIDLRGSFKGMGGDAKDNYAMLGLALIDAKKSVFVKMTGPADVVANLNADFTTFIQSIVPADAGKAVMKLQAVPGTEEAPAAMPAPEAAAPQPAAESTATGGAIPPADQIQWDQPAGWDKNPDRPMRLVTFTSGTSECYISVLGGMAGGVEANIGRWYGQMGKQAPSADELAALEKVTVLGEPCGIVDIEGSFQGMQGEKVEDARLLGVVRVSDEASIFVKMTGPANEIADQRENFIAFVKSLR